MSEPAANSQYDTHLSPQQQQQQSTSTCQAVTPKPHPNTKYGQKVNKGFSLFSRKLQTERRKIALKYFLNYLIMGVGVLAIFSIYWGSFYGINGRIKI